MLFFSSSPLLDGTLADKTDVFDGKYREKRLSFTLWTTTTTTLTVTSTSINSSTTFALSFFCTVAGVPFPPACG